MTSKSDPYVYLTGFGNQHSSESLPGALPKGQNTPQVCHYGLYAEQLSGSAFTAPRHLNQRSWLYRKRPSVCHPPFRRSDLNPHVTNVAPDACITPNQLRWSPFTLPTTEESMTFVMGLRTIAISGDPSTKHGCAFHIYMANTSMTSQHQAFYNADGEMLIVPEEGEINVQTEFGMLRVEPEMIVVIPRGAKFSVDLVGENEFIRGYVLEVYNGPFQLPDLGPIGANGLANPRDFEYPVAYHSPNSETTPFMIIAKYISTLHQTMQPFSPYNVVAWHGNYAPYRYNLKDFCAVNSVTYDHLDPSIFTVLTCKSEKEGTAVADFVVFPPRWMVAERTFRPPYFHRNCMSEFMGLIRGRYEAKSSGFLPGGASLHSIMSAHGPDTETFKKASDTSKSQIPTRVADGTMAFMFESCYMMKTTQWAMEEAGKLQDEYWKAWEGLEVKFKEA